MIAWNRVVEDRMKRNNGWLTLYVVWLLVSLPLLGSNFSIVSVDSLIRAGMEETIRNDFAGAQQRFQTLIDQYPQRPCGYFYVGAAVQAEMLDAEQYDRLEEFLELMTVVIEKGGKILEENPSDHLARFMVGSAYLYRSFMDSKRGKMWGAYRNAGKGVDQLEKIIEDDSTFYDAYLGVGSFKYWKSEKAGSLRWLPFLDDERELGIRMVRRSLQRGRLVSLVARDQLAWILLAAGDLDGAAELAAENHAHYPDSRFFLSTRVEVLYKARRFRELQPLYEQLLDSVREVPNNNHHNEIRCLHRLAEIHFQEGRVETAVGYLETLFALPLSNEVRKNSGKHLKAAQELQGQCRAELDRQGVMSRP